MLRDDPHWYQDAIIYEVHVRAFHDSDGDGMGDFRGLTQKLDYLEDLGVTAIWLLPFYPSPWRDDGYDIADYTSVHPSYGTLEDFQEFLQQAHRRGMRVITELVINHTSDQHPWFQRARRAPRGSSERDFYVWSDTADKYPGVPLMFPDFEASNWAWDPVAQQYYWHRFYSHQPDLNFDHPAVWEAILPVVDFWLGMGVDGLRLDAVPYLYEREGTSCEHLPETHAFLRALRRHIDERFANRMLLAEANAWPEEAAAYFGAGDECHMAFHFPLMPRLFMAVQQEDAFPIRDIFAQTPPVPEGCQWGLFLRNHDEMTLAMVTDEERDRMYRAFARDGRARIFQGIRHRLAPLLENDRRRVELLTALLFSLPGTPVIYYGDEIGMGDNIYLGDRNGVRTPMQWSADRNAGFSRAASQRLYLPVVADAEYHFEALNVEAQQNNPTSLLWWTKRMVALRQRFGGFGRGGTRFLECDNPRVLVFLRAWRGRTVLVAANLSRFVQHALLPLQEFAGSTPEEMFGGARFPRVDGAQAYPLSLAGYACHWFELHPPQPRESPREQALGELWVQADWSELVVGPGRDELQAALPGFFRAAPAGVPRSARIVRAFPFRTAARQYWVVAVRLEFQESLPETALLPLCLLDEGTPMLQPLSRVAICRVRGGAAGVLCNASALPDYLQAILQMVLRQQSLRLEQGEILGSFAGGTEEAQGALPEPTQVECGAEAGVVAQFGGRWQLRTYGRVEEGPHPDVEVPRFLARQQFAGMVPVLGVVEFRRRNGTRATLAALRPVPAQPGTAWQHLLHQLSGFFERAAALPAEAAGSPEGVPGLFDDCAATAAALGERTALLHRTLACDAADPAFKPEPFTRVYQRSVYQSMRNDVALLGNTLGGDLSHLPAETLEELRPLRQAGPELFARFQAVLELPATGARIRCHGDYHLGRLVHVGNDFLLADFEGDATRPISDRQIKRSPLRDVASMVRSFDYAIGSVLLNLVGDTPRAPGILRAQDLTALATWGHLCLREMTGRFLRAYLAIMGTTGLLPPGDLQRRRLLELFLLQKAIGELIGELRHRPAWVPIPLRAIRRTLQCLAPPANTSASPGTADDPVPSCL